MTTLADSYKSPIDVTAELCRKVRKDTLREVLVKLNQESLYDYAENDLSVALSIIEEMFENA